MNLDHWEPQHFLVLGYVVSIAALWGYAAMLWMESRSLHRRESRGAATPDEDLT